jgi:hypothetical protein
MLVAVARKKGEDGQTDRGGREPREDLVTSAIFGSLQLLPFKKQAKAIADIIEYRPCEGREFEFIYWPTPWSWCDRCR